MRKFNFMMALVLTAFFTTVSCKDSNNGTLEENLEQHSDELEDASENIGDARDNMEDALEDFQEALESIDNPQEREAIRERINAMIDTMNAQM